MRSMLFLFGVLLWSTFFMWETGVSAEAVREVEQQLESSYGPDSGYAFVKTINGAKFGENGTSQSIGYRIEHDEAVEFEFASHREGSILSRTYGVNGRKFLSTDFPSFNLSAGLSVITVEGSVDEYEHFDTGPLSRTSIQGRSYYDSANAIINLGVGNSWQFGRLVIGADWVSTKVKFATLKDERDLWAGSSRRSSITLVAEEDEDHVVQRMNTHQFSLLNAYVGLSF